jgi:hypothetical protein
MAAAGRTPPPCRKAFDYSTPEKDWTIGLSRRGRRELFVRFSRRRLLYHDKPQANELIDRGLKMRSLLSQLSAYMRSNPLAGPTVSDIIFAQTTDILSETQRAALDGIIQQMQSQRSMGEAVRLNTPPTPSTGGPGWRPGSGGWKRGSRR